MGGRAHLQCLLKEFTEAVNDCGLSDLGLKEKNSRERNRLKNITGFRGGWIGV